MASSHGTDADKGALRQGYLAARRALPARDKAVADARIRDTLLRFDVFRDAELVLAYVSTEREIDTRAIIDELLSTGRRVAVPMTDPKTRELSFFEISSMEELRPGFHGILEPEASDAGALAFEDLLGSVCLVPGLVFDAQGHRVGYGGGSYDRFLWHYPGDKIALARAMHVSSNPLPIEAHDVPVDFIVTEASVWACR
ncbi:MAG: 5-formyltetrahydrofolate cyclo-ligase [Collinsella sp.]|nr:5-formyltetrahydrofolate cyclo-ligase [Collinsella sp.]